MYREPHVEGQGEQVGRVWCVIPVYNNARTVRDVAAGCRMQLDDVLVVDDASTDVPAVALLEGMDVTVLSHDRNRGKGAAILTAAAYIRRRGGTHLVTIDADGQHSPQAIPKFLTAIREDAAAIVIGCREFETENVPASSRFGRQFSNMWIRLETGLDLRDTQSGFRAYPLRCLDQLHLCGRRYEFEVEVLTRAAWSGVPVREVDVSVSYAAPGQRVSHFRPLVDNLRISLMHSRLVGRRLLPFGHARIVPAREAVSAWSLLRNPRTFLETLLKENATPIGLAAAAGIGTILAVLPLIGLHSLIIIYIATRLHVNKIMALTIQNLYAPPFVPFLCVELGYYMRYGHWWTEFSMDSMVVNLHQRLFEWLLGSLFLAPLCAVLAATVVFLVARRLQRGRTGTDASCPQE